MEKAILAGTAAVRLRRAAETDLDFVLAAQTDPDNAPYIGQWTREEYRATFADPDKSLLVIESVADSRAVGFMLVEGLANPNRSIEFRRIAVTAKGNGYGRAALHALKGLAFDTWGAHRLWLDVKDFNRRARSLYDSAGFVVEGTKRDCLKTADGYESLVLMSMLDSEYRRDAG